MDDGLRLLIDLHLWFLATLSKPYALGAFSLIPVGGIACLMIGTVFGLARPRRSLLLFVLPVAISQVFLLAVGPLNSAFPEGGYWIGLVFIASQAAIIGTAVIRNRTVWIPALCLSVFCLIYAYYIHFAAATILNRLPVS